jgi:hypothetical protein
MKKYEISVVYRGQQITKIVCAKNALEAANLLEVNKYFINKYAFKNKINVPFEGIIAYYDSGYLWEKEKKFIRVKMPYEKLKSIIDQYKDKEYNDFLKNINKAL